MMKIYSFFLFIFLNVGVFAQTAPDFTITDSGGVEHTLYEDYLDQGQVVMLKFFFVSCPPCNAIAPEVQALYEDWGSGEHDVEFIELSIFGSDDDDDVNGYKNQHGITFPGAGGDGGSVAAVKPYRDGDFGPFTATPVFAVIAPDGTVNWDVFGFGEAGQIAALEEAFIDAGASKPVASSTGDTRAEVSSMIISPNPFYDQAEVKINTQQSGQLTYQLFDVLGNEIQQNNLGKISPGQHVFNHDYSTLRMGTYFVRYSIDNQPIKSLVAIKK